MRRICAAYAPHMRRNAISYHIISYHITPYHSISYSLFSIIYLKPSTLFFFWSFSFGDEPSRGLYKHKVNRIPKKWRRIHGLHFQYAAVNDADEIKKPPEIGGFLFGNVRLLYYKGILHFFPSKHEIGLITIAVTILSSLT